MRVVVLAGLALVIFVVAVVVLWTALFLAAAVFGGSCGERCYTDVYLGPSVLVAIVLLATVIASVAVRIMAHKRRPG